MSNGSHWRNNPKLNTFEDELQAEACEKVDIIKIEWSGEKFEFSSEGIFYNGKKLDTQSNHGQELVQAFVDFFAVAQASSFLSEQMRKKYKDALIIISEYWNLSEESAFNAADVCREIALEALGETDKEEEDKKSEVVFWTCDEDPEGLNLESMDEAIEAKIDEEGDDLVGVLEVYGYKRKTISESSRKYLAELALETIGEYLDENYGGEDGHDVTDKMAKAAKVFVDSYLREYTPWQCELAETVEINLADWRRDHGE